MAGAVCAAACGCGANDEVLSMSMSGSVSVSKLVGGATAMASASSGEGFGVVVEMCLELDSVAWEDVASDAAGAGNWVGLSVSRVNVGGACLASAALITNC